MTISIYQGLCGMRQVRERPKQRERRKWQSLFSSRPGFESSYSTVTPQGDDLNVDFNSRLPMVSIRIRPAKELGNEYVALIQDGKIMRQYEASSGRFLDLNARIRPLAFCFENLPNQAILQAIGRNFGIPSSNRLDAWEVTARAIRRKGQSARPAALKGYLQERRRAEQAARPFWRQLLHRLPAEGLDISLGVVAYWTLSTGFFGAVEAALLLGFLGIFFGGLDWAWRQRSPFLPKVLLFLLAGFLIIYLNLQYRNWALL